jgi:nucleolar complex protein 2
MYLEYVRTCKVSNAKALTHASLLRNAVAELYTMDEKAAYTHAFVYIRQLAVHLRTALTVRRKEALSQVYNWQFVQSIRGTSLSLSQCRHGRWVKVA